MAEHAPAPWSAERSAADGYLWIKDRDGKVILCPTTDGDLSCRPEDMALILATPALLAACRLALADSVSEDVLDAARAALLAADPAYALDRIDRLVASCHFRFASEKDLQDAIASVFAADGIPFVREHQLGNLGTIDFLVEGGVGIEAKVGGSTADAIRQLHRYARHEKVKALLLVTSRSRLADLPQTMNGKPVRGLVIAGAFA